MPNPNSHLRKLIYLAPQRRSFFPPSMCVGHAPMAMVPAGLTLVVGLKALRYIRKVNRDIIKYQKR